MKKIMLNVPDDVAQDFGEKVKDLLSEFDIEADNDGVLDCLLPITERVKTVEDALRVLGTPNEEIKDFFKPFEKLGEDVVAYMKLRVITEALNEGWKPTFSEDEYRWWPWFRYYSKEEIEEMSEEKRQKLGLVGAHAISGSRSGLAYVFSKYGWSHTYAFIGSRLAYKSEALADYSGRQFREIWEVYVGKL